MIKAYTAEDFRHALAGRENGGVTTDWEHDYIVDAALRIAARVAEPGVIEDLIRPVKPIVARALREELMRQGE